MAVLSENLDIPGPLPEDELLGMDAVLNRLSEFDPRGAGLVKLCFFVELTQEQAARALNVSIRAVERIWLFREM